MQKKFEKIEKITEELLEIIGEDPNRNGLKKTPLRVSKSWKYFSTGYRTNLEEIVNNAIFEEDCSEMILVKNIEYFSLCEHHLVPFFGRCHVGYIPDGRIIGLSKIPRIVDMFARRLQVQERLTAQIAESLAEILKPVGVGVIVEGRHLCMQMRGVEKQNSIATTSAMLGQFRKSAETRSEFISLTLSKN
ncbi:MAG: GTP cyclohydrolase I FolE [Candidatus Neomarinimicrobiota bacterium]